MNRLVTAALVAAVFLFAPAPGARADELVGRPADGGWVLDAHGGLHEFGGAAAVAGSGWWPGQDLARGIVARVIEPGGWVLDAYGGLHPFGGAPATAVSWYAPGQDLARGVARSAGSAGWVVDAYGGLHEFGGAAAVAGSWYEPGRDLARGIVLGEQGGWVLDAEGSLHEFGGAPPMVTTWSAPGRDLARGVVLDPEAGGGGWVLDAYGGLHEFGGARPVQGTGWWPGRDLARAIVVHGDGSSGGWVVDAYGGLHAFGTARAETASWWAPGIDLARGAAGSGGGSGSRGDDGPPVRRTVTYDVRTTGETRSTAADLAASAADTYADTRGWRAAGVAFRQVPSGGDFTLWLATPERMRSFSSVCSSFYSCRVGRNVIINDDRFSGGSPYWPGSVADYRDLVVNHETGHWLGLGHAGCPAPGAAAPVMMQQSKGLQGCAPNPWPTLSELATVRGG